MSKTFEYENEDGDVETIELPTRMEVCDECDGHGYVLCDGMRGHAYSAEEFAEEFDHEQQEQYFKRGGRYDVACPECGGRNVVAVVDEERLTEAQKAAYLLIQREEDRRAADRRADECTRRMECGGGW